ncbi:MAG TPA: DUF4238 domain-containing protein [Candidatus Paceibacterota bacterium]|nr:DUF4238 domain-containing protein [Candidatus Paceibacterota bacterium]
MKLSSLNKKFISYCVKKRLGRNNFTIKVIYSITGLLGRFEVYKNSHEFQKRGHYIPQFLLRRFRLSELRHDPNRKKIYQYNFLFNTLTEEKIEVVAQIEDFYIFKQNGGGSSDYVEKVILADWIENFGSQILKTINTTEDDPNLTLLEKNILATFISHQITRTPAFYFQLRKYILFLYEKKLLKIDNLSDHNFLKEIIVKNKYNFTYDDLVNFVPEYTMTGDLNHLGFIARLIAGEITEGIFRHNFYFLNIPDTSDDEFVISDNPVIFVDFQKFEIKRYFDWWSKSSGKTWIFMPISPKKCLFLTTKQKIDGRIENDQADMVALVNFGQYLNALNYVYGRNKNLMLQNLRKYLPELLRYKTIIADPIEILNK